MCAALDRLSGHGRAGADMLRAALAGRDGDEAVPATVLERRAQRILRMTTVPAPVRQFPVGPSRLDRAWPEVKLGWELDSYRWHSSPRALERDRARQNWLAAHGWVLLRHTWAGVTLEPGRIADEIDRTYQGRRTELGVAGVVGQPQPRPDGGA